MLGFVGQGALQGAEAGQEQKTGRGGRFVKGPRKAAPYLVLSAEVVLQKALAQQELQIGSGAGVELSWVDAHPGLGRKILPQRDDGDHPCTAPETSACVFARDQPY